MIPSHIITVPSQFPIFVLFAVINLLHLVQLEVHIVDTYCTHC